MVDDRIAQVDYLGSGGPAAMDQRENTLARYPGAARECGRAGIRPPPSATQPRAKRVMTIGEIPA